MKVKIKMTMVANFTTLSQTENLLSQIKELCSPSIFNAEVNIIELKESEVSP